MTGTRLILAGLLAGALALGTACRSDKAAERAPAETEQAPPGNQDGTTIPPEGTGGAGDQGQDDFGAPSGVERDTVPEDYSGLGNLNPENQGTGGAGDPGQSVGDHPQTGSGGSGVEQDNQFRGDSFPNDSERTNDRWGRDLEDPSPAERP